MNINQINRMLLLILILLNGGICISALENENDQWVQGKSNNTQASFIKEDIVQEINEITWWDLLSEEEVAYYKKLNESYSADPYYIPDSDPPPPAVNKKLHGKKVQIIGYVVAVDIDQKDFTKAKSFLFVPYQGACVHVPPPPTNQTIFVESREAKHFDPYTAFWLEGTIYIEKGSNEFASFSYRVISDNLNSYVDENW